MTPILSIVVPHKNSVNTLESLLSTVPDVSEVEVIIVDDKSKTSEQIALRQLGNSRNNVSIYYNEGDESNAGVARNIGIKYLTGDWVFFADADDEFVEGSFHSLFSATLEFKESDVVLFKCQSLNENRELDSRADKVNELLKNYPTNKDTILYEWLVPWGKLIKTRVVKCNYIEFSSCVASNDVMFSTKLASKAKNISIMSDTVYCCMSRCGSLTSNLNETKALSRLNMLVERNNYLSTKKISLKKDLGFTYFCNSKPWELNKKKISIYFRWLWQLAFRR